MVTNVKSKAAFATAVNRTVAAKLQEIVSILDFGAVCDGTTDDSVAINAAITAVTALPAGGFVVIPANTNYVEASLNLATDVTLVDYSTPGVIRYLSADAGTSLPVTVGGVGIKTKGIAEILLRAHNSGSAALPYLQLLRRDTGQLAGLSLDFLSLIGASAAGFIDLPEISTPTAPGVNSGRLFIKDNGSGKSQLCVRFNSGVSQCFATEP